jgi:hypothetical protein
MRKVSALLLAPVPSVLLAAAVLGTCGGDGDTAAPRRGATSSSSTRESTPATTEPEAAVPAEAAQAARSPVSPLGAPSPRASGDVCDAAAVHDAIASSDAVAPELAFEVTYLECADGYGWAEIAADFGDGATVLLEGSGPDIVLLDLGTAVCPIESGMPASLATRLAPPDSSWLAECPA